MERGNSVDAGLATKKERDLLFKCEQCGIPLVVDCAAAGMILTCQRCGKPTAVPSSLSTAGVPNDPAHEPVKKLGELSCCLKENESQRTEITGYINQLNIQLHRWQLRLQLLNDRNKELSDELAGLLSRGEPDEG